MTEIENTADLLERYAETETDQDRRDAMERGVVALRERELLEAGLRETQRELRQAHTRIEGAHARARWLMGVLFLMALVVPAVALGVS